MTSIRTKAALALAIALMAATAGADDRAVTLLTASKNALGGAKLEAVQSLTASGELRRVFGEREISGDLTIDLAVPDRIRRTEDMGIPGGPSMTRVVGLDAGEFWEDATNRGGGAFMRMAPGGPGGPAGREITEEDRQRFREMQHRRLEGDLHRLTLVWLLRTDAPVAYVGTAEADDGQAEVVEIRREGREPMRLFLDASTHLPLMLTYEGFMPRMRMMQRTPGSAPPPEGGPRPWSEPPERVTFELRFDDYRQVNGVLLPHRFTQSVGGTANEEWTISRYKVNPSFKKDTFTKK